MADCSSRPVFGGRQVDRERGDVAGGENVVDVRLKELVDDDVAATIEFDVRIGLKSRKITSFQTF